MSDEASKLDSLKFCREELENHEMLRSDFASTFFSTEPKVTSEMFFGHDVMLCYHVLPKTNLCALPIGIPGWKAKG